MMEGTSWSGLTSLSQGLDHLPMRGKGILKFTKISYRIMSEWLFASWCLVEVGWCSQTMTLSIKLKPPQTGFRIKKICFLEWPSQGPDLNPIEILWNDLKRSVHTRHPTNMSELKQFCKEKLSKIPPKHCAGLIQSYRMYLIEVIAANRGSTSYQR